MKTSDILKQVGLEINSKSQGSVSTYLKCGGTFDYTLPYQKFTAESALREFFYKNQLSLTNPRDALHHGERAANK